MAGEKRARYRCPKCGRVYTSSFPFEHMYCLPNKVHSEAVRMARIVGSGPELKRRPHHEQD